MTYEVIPVFAQAPPLSTVGLILTLAFSLPTIIALVGIWAGAWTKINRLRLETALKQQMIDRGMSADEIVKVLTRSKSSDEATELPCASEVVVESGGEWHTALMLKQEGERFYVHFVGTDMSDNEWVTGERVRFPASSNHHCGAPWDWSFPAGVFGAGDWCGKGGRSKPAPVDQEI